MLCRASGSFWCTRAGRRVFSTFGNAPLNSQTQKAADSTGALQLRIARCPESDGRPSIPYYCSQCSKAFIHESAVKAHERRHATHRHTCAHCGTGYGSPEALYRHRRARHNSHRERHVCGTCGDEYASKANLELHLSRSVNRDDHVSKRNHIQFSSPEEINDVFCFPSRVNGNFVFHTTDRNGAKELLSGERSLRGSHAANVHDGCLRRDDAPRVTFFSALETLYPLSPHPVNAEPGELAASIPVSLDNFADDANANAYRLYFVACTSLLGSVCDEASLRVTVMFAREEHWAWCEERSLVQLDMHSNSLLRRVVEDGTRPFWELATHYYSSELGLRQVNLAVTVAGDTLNLARLPEAPPTRFDVFHAFRSAKSESVQCPSCNQQFFNPGDMYGHYHVGSASLADGSSAGHPKLAFAGRDARAFKCPVQDCVRTFSERKYLSAHLRIHLDARPYLCRVDPECGRFLKTKWSLEVHERLHNTNPHVCRFDPPTCKVRFKTEHERDIHEQLHVPGATPYKCDFPDCDYAASRRNTLKRHQSTVHRNNELLLASQTSYSNRERLFNPNVTVGSDKSLSALDFARQDPAIKEILSLKATETSPSRDGSRVEGDGDPSPKLRLKRYPEEFRRAAARFAAQEVARTAGGHHSERIAVEHVAQDLGIPTMTLFSWRQKYGTKLDESQAALSREDVLRFIRDIPSSKRQMISVVSQPAEFRHAVAAYVAPRHPQFPFVVAALVFDTPMNTVVKWSRNLQNPMSRVPKESRAAIEKSLEEWRRMQREAQARKTNLTSQ